MTLVACWILLPLVLGALALGCGLLLETIAGRRLPGVLLAPAGLAVIIVAAQAAVANDHTAEFATPLVIALAVAGFALGVPGRARSVDPWAVVAAVGVYAIFAAPVVLSGEATFAGYIKLDDTATWLAITDRVMDHGRSLDGLGPSTYEVTLQSYLSNGYPVGSFLPLGIAHTLIGEDSAWLFQPYIAFLASMMALALYALAGSLVRTPWLRAVVAFLAAQPAILFGYSLWGGVKEIAGAWILVTVAALLVPVVPPVKDRLELRALIAPAVGCAATLAILSVAGAAWVAPSLLLALGILIVTRGFREVVLPVLIFTVLGAILSIPPLLYASAFLDVGNQVLRSESELGNLIEPLRGLQVLGIWPVGDFRFDPTNLDATYLLLGILVVAGVAGLVFASLKRAWGPLLYFAGAAVGVLVATQLGSPWVDGKAMTTASPAFVLLGLLGGAAILERSPALEVRLVGGMAVAAIAGGLLWSNALAYREVTLAPRDRFAELEDIGHQIAGEGPTLMTDYEPYGVRHFLRDAEPEGASEFRRRQIPLKGGRILDKLEVADIDEFQLPAILVYRSLVLRRSATASRPPSVYRLVSSSRNYELWQRSEIAAEPPGKAIIEHLPLGNTVEPTDVPRCRDVLRLARRAGPQGRLATVERPRAVVIDLASIPFPPSWRTVALSQSALLPVTDGSIDNQVDLPRGGRYGFWMGGAFRRKLEVIVDGQRVSSERQQLSHAGHYVPMGEERLSKGVHGLVLKYGDEGLRPGTRGEAFPIGPFVVSRTTADSPVRYVPSSDASSLCGKRLDWIEALRS